MCLGGRITINIESGQQKGGTVLMWELRRRSPLLRIILLISSGTIGTVLTVGVTIVLLIALLVALIGGSTPGGQGPTIITASHEWTGQRNQSVVEKALYVASGLYNGPPDGLDTWYVPDQIPNALAYWRQTCPGFCDGVYAQGNLQCVMLVTAAYGMDWHGLPGQKLPYVGAAITFWLSDVYQHTSGWEAVMPTDMPYPGDILVLDSGTNFGGVGHVAIIVDIKPPNQRTGAAGYVQFAEANGPGPLAAFSLTQDATGNLNLHVWHGYKLKGYIRHSAVLTH